MNAATLRHYDSAQRAAVWRRLEWLLCRAVLLFLVLFLQCD